MQTWPTPDRVGNWSVYSGSGASPSVKHRTARTDLPTADISDGRLLCGEIDQARGEPYKWGGGMAGYGRRYEARYGEFVVQNSIVAAGNALLRIRTRI